MATQLRVEPRASGPDRRPQGDDQRQRPRSRTPRRPRELTSTDLITMAGAAGTALCLNWLVFGRLGDGQGWFALLVSTYLTFLACFFIATADRYGRLVATDRTITVVVVSAGGVVLAALASLVIFILVLGLKALRPGFFTSDQTGITPLLPSTEGGGSHAVVGTLEQTALSLVLSLPLSLGAAVFLNESRSRWRRPVRIFVDAMSGLPSIVCGLFIFAVFIQPHAKDAAIFGFNGLMASLSLSLIMIPTITRTVEVVLRLVPDGLREASLALGASRARTVWSVVFPTARTGMTTAIVLGIARCVGETAPLIYTAFGYDLMNANPFNGSQEALPLFVFRNVQKPDQTAIERGFAGALVLMVIVLALFALARYLGRDRTRRAAPSRRWRPRAPRPTQEVRP